MPLLTITFSITIGRAERGTVMESDLVHTSLLALHFVAVSARCADLSPYTFTHQISAAEVIAVDGESQQRARDER